MEQANYLQDPVATLQAIHVGDGEAITLPPEILNTILEFVADRNSLLVCRLVNKLWSQFSYSKLQTHEITIHFKKRRQFSPHSDLKVVSKSLDQLSSLNALLRSSIPSSNFPCRNFLFQGVRISENVSFHQFLCNYGDKILKLAFEECEIPYSYHGHVVEETGNSCYQSFVYWVMQKVPNLTHLYFIESTFFVNKGVATTGQMVKNIEQIYFQHLSEFHFRPDDYHELKHFLAPPITNFKNRINDIFVNQVLNHCPNLKKYFSRPSINKVEHLSHLVDNDNVSKLKNFALNPESRFNCENTVRLIEKFVHEDLPKKLVLEELDIDITPLPFKSTVATQRERSWIYVTLTNQLLENNKTTLKFLTVSTYDDDGETYMEPMEEKLQFPQLMPNVDTFELGISMDTVNANLSSWKDFLNAIFFPCGTIERLNWAHIFPHLQKFICWNFNQLDKDNSPFLKDDQDHMAPFDYKIPTVTCLKIGQSSSETIKYFGKVCPSVQHFIFLLSCRVFQQRIFWHNDRPLIFKDVIRRALNYFPVLTKLDIDLQFDVVRNVELTVAFVQELQDDILGFLLRNPTVDDQQGYVEQGQVVEDLKALSCLTFTITTKILDFTRQSFTLRDRRGKSCNVVVVVQ